MSPLVYRILTWTLRVLVGLALVVAVLFSVFILNPFEGRLPSIDEVVPDGVNLFAAKEVAGEEAAGFLRTAFWRRLTRTRAYQLWVRSPEWRRSGAAADLENAFSQLNIIKEDFRVDPLAEVASREIGLALRFRRHALPDFLLFLRLSFLARAYVALLEHGVFRNLTAMPIEAVPGTALLDLRLPEGSDLPHVYLTRLKDVLVVGSDPALVKASRRRARGEGVPFRRRAGPTPGGEGNPIGFRFSPDPGRLAADWSRQVVPPGLDPLVRTFLEAADPIGLAGLGGRFYLARSPHLEVDAAFHPDAFRPLQKAIFESPAPDIVKAMDPFVRLAPRELMAFLYVQMKPRDVGAFAEDALDAETMKLVEKTLAPTPLKNLHALLDRWLGELEPGFAVYLNRQAFETVPTNPPYFGFTVVFRMRNNRLWQTIHFDLLDYLKEDLTIADVDLEQPRVDVELMFYRFRANPYADVSTPAFARFGDLVAFSTSADFLRRMADLYLGEGRYGLAGSGEIKALFEARHRLDGNAALFLFLDVRRTLKWVDDMAPSWAHAAALRRLLDNAAAKRRALVFQARSFRSLKTDRDRERWVDTRMEAWYGQLDAELKQRVRAVVGPMVSHLGILHTVGLTLGPSRSGEAQGLSLRSTFNFDP